MSFRSNQKINSLSLSLSLFNLAQQMPSNFPSFSNRNFGYPQQQQQQQPASDSQKVYHVPIHIEQDGGQSNSYVKISEPSGYQTNQPPQNNHQNNYQQQRQPNNAFYQNNPTEQMHYERSYSPSNRAPSPFYKNAADHHKSDLRDRSEQEFKRQNDELFKKQADELRSANRAPSTNQANEYRIPIRIEGDSDSSNLVRDFNKMHGPSTARTSHPGQKNSTPAGDFVDSKDFNNVPASYQHQPQSNQQNLHHLDQQQQQQNQQPAQQQQQRPTQQPKKPPSPMAIVQDILEEVERYEHEVDYFQGVYQDKQWKYLDEYLTRCMLKLDTIDTCGDMNLKQARKNALNYIQKVITKLENIEKMQIKESGKAGDEESKKETSEMEQDVAGKVANDEQDSNKQTQPEVKEGEEKEDDKLSDDKKEPDDLKADAKSKDKSDKKAKSEEKKAEKKKASKKPDGKDKKKIKKDEGK